MKLFGSSGIRRIYDKSFLDVAEKIGILIGEKYQHAIIGRDTRPSGIDIVEYFARGFFSAGGRDIVYCGVVPTPTVAYNAQLCDVGIVITASHNPEEYNGIKLFNKDGSSFTRKQELEIEKEYPSVNIVSYPLKHIIEENNNPLENHISNIVNEFKNHKFGNIYAFIDYGNGAASVATPEVFSRLNINALNFGCDISARFSRPSEPLPENVPNIPIFVSRLKNAYGIIHDGDGDRMMAFDNKGRFITGDQMMALFADYLGAKRIVTNIEASMLIENFGKVYRTAIGDSRVSEKLKTWGDFGGEPSGSWMFPHRGTLCPDGIYAATLFMKIASEINIAEFIDNLPKYYTIRKSYPIKNPDEKLIELGAENPRDGIREEFDNGWYLVRASGTEPKIRIMVESENESDAREVSNKIIAQLG